MKIGLFLSVWLLIGGMALPARAELPDYILDRDYQSCVADDKDSERAAYCQCVRDGMKNWDPDTYVEAAMQAAAVKPGSGAVAPGKLEDHAKSCIAQTLH